MTRRQLTALLAVLALTSYSSVARAGLIEINLAGTGLEYSDPAVGGDDGTLKDTGSPYDALGSLTFNEDGSLLGVLSPPTTPMFFDLDVGGLPSVVLPGAGNSTSVTSTTGGSFALYVGGSTPADVALELDLDTVELVYSNLSAGMFNIRVLFSGSVGEIVSQDLPFGIDLLNPVTLSFTLSSGNVTTSGGYLTSYTGSAGSGLVSAERVPEPSTLLMAGLVGAMGIAVVRARKQA